MPGGVEETVPVPVPALPTLRVNVWRPKVAVTVVAAVTATLQAPVPEQPPPLQPVNVAPPAGLAVNVTTVPLSYEAEQVAPQSIPAGLEVTVPVPVPHLATVRRNLCRSKVAVTVVAALMVTVHAPVPEQPAPDQPVKPESLAGAAVSVTAVPPV